MPVSKKLKHYYQQNRLWQLKTYSVTGLFIDGVDQRRFAGGGAAYGHHAEAAFLSAKSTIHFITKRRRYGRYGRAGKG